MVQRKRKDDTQLSLFEDNPSTKQKSVPSSLTTAVDFVRARFEQNPDMTEEEYRRWIRVLVQSSIRRME